MTSTPDADLLHEQILHLCKDAIHPRDIFASCFYGPRVYEPALDSPDMNILVIIPNYSPKLMNLAKKKGSINLFILAIDRRTFETDVEKGSLGELATGIVTLPYQPLTNAGYLKEMEVRIKKRLVVEILRNIVRQYPEMSVEFLIQPEYFLYEVIRRRVKLFHPSAFSFSRLLSGKAGKRNLDSMMEGYLGAFKELEIERQVVLTEGYIKIDKDFIETTRQTSDRLSSIQLSIRKALLPYVQGISKATAALSPSPRLLKNKVSKNTEERLLAELEETERYILMPTPLGPVPLSNKTSIQEFVRRTVPGGEELKIEIEQMGGVLNSVFQVRIERDHEAQRIIVKKYEDWMGFKWFPLALWALGTHSFAVLGTTRLEREYAASQFLRKMGFHVPTILYVSPKERLIFMEFVEGKKSSEVIRHITASSPKKTAPSDVDGIRVIGTELAKVHMAGMALGDCKPENTLVSKNGQVYFLDLEQAARNGDQPWDIAEFLYYSGHYVLPGHSDDAARTIATSFIEGYLEAGGKRSNVKKAAGAKYTKVFTIFTLPNVILIMANICKSMGGRGSE